MGKRIQQGEREFTFSDGGKQEMLQIKMQVHTVEGFSGHSSRNQLMSFVRKLDPKPKKIILVHGESSKCLDLASSIHKTFRIETVAPRTLDAIRIR